ncbi:MAG: GDSL-type esterase/lipase family protein [Acidimicrobiales bacterium]
MAESAPSAPAPGIVVDPSSGLAATESVQVTGSGFSPSSQIAVAECETGATTAGQCSPSGVVETTTQSTGAFSVAFTVTSEPSIGGSTLECGAIGCAIGAGQLPALATFATAPIAFSAAPAPTKNPNGPYYLALGDSLANGFGATAGQGYVDDLFARYRAEIPGLQEVDLACDGETTTSFINGGGCNYSEGSQLGAAEAFMSSHPGQVAFITMDIGGNDITGCATATPALSISQGCLSDAEQVAGLNLSAIGRGLRAAGGPGVPIFGMTYYDPFVVDWLAGGAGVSESEQSVGDLETFNAALSSAYESFGASVADVFGAFQASDFAEVVSSPYGSVPKNVALACAWLLVECEDGGVGAISIHPNASGYSEIATAFEAVIRFGSPPPAPPPLSGPQLAYTGFEASPLVVAASCLLGIGIALLALSKRRQRPSG